MSVIAIAVYLFAIIGVVQTVIFVLRKFEKTDAIQGEYIPKEEAANLPEVGDVWWLNHEDEVCARIVHVTRETVTYYLSDCFPCNTRTMRQFKTMYRRHR